MLVWMYVVISLFFGIKEEKLKKNYPCLSKISPNQKIKILAATGFSGNDFLTSIALINIYVCVHTQSFRL